MPSFAWFLFMAFAMLVCVMVGFVWGMDTERGRQKKP